MPYFSEVAFSLSNKAHKELLAIAADNQPLQELLDNADKTLTINGCYLYYWDRVQWHDYYASVVVINDFIINLTDTERHDEYKLLKIGEGHVTPADDIDENGDMQEPFQINSIIETQINFAEYN